MASIQRRGDKHQLRVKHKLLPKPFFFTFETEAAAKTYGEQLEALLSRGILPQELIAKPTTAPDPLLIEVIREYSKRAPITDSDSRLLAVVLTEIAGLRVSGVSFRWAEDYVRARKVKDNLAPSTIRKRVGLLGRILDWHIRQTTGIDVQPAANPLRLLPIGYSIYGQGDGAVEKRDVQRNRRLTSVEDGQIRIALAGTKRDDRQRALAEDADFALLYAIIVDTGLRLFEAYRLRVDSVDIQKNLLYVDGSKGHRGIIKPRFVPLKIVLREALATHCAGRTGLLFTFWDGKKESRDQTTGKLSARFSKLFEYASVPDFLEHDLRHEACCRWFELRNERGWVFSDIEVCKIMGWTDTRMALRYASLRGEDLSARLG